MPERRKKKPNEIRANRIVLEDMDGEPKILLDASSKGLTTLSFFDQRTRLTMGVDPDGLATITFFNKDGKAALSMGTSSDIGQGLQIHDAEGRPVCFISVRPDGIPRIQLINVTSPTEGAVFWSTPTPKKP